MGRKKRTQLAVNVRGHTVHARTGDAWEARFGPLEIVGSGPTRDDAWVSLLQRLDEVTNSGDAGIQATWQSFCQDNIIEIEMTDGEVAAEEERRAAARRLNEGKAPRFRPLTTADFDEAIAGRPTVVDFWAAWCEPCLAMVPALEDIAETMADRVTVASVDVDAEEGLWSRFDLRGIPTLIVFADGRELGRIAGVRSAPELAEEITRLLPPG